MAHEYHYHQPSVRLEFYTVFEDQGSPPPPGDQPAFVHDFVPVRQDDSLTFARGETDIRQFPLNTPNGDTLGTVIGYLVDTAHDTIPYAYVQFTGERVVVVPTNQLMIYPEQCITILEGGIEALRSAPDARFDLADAQKADHYWLEYRQRHAA